MSLRTIGSRAIVLGGLTAFILMAFGAEVTLAADYQDKGANVCEGNGTFEPTKGCPEWGKHLTTGEQNVALGAEMMQALTSGNANVALGFRALESDTQGSTNVAVGREALELNTTGNDNVATGSSALTFNTTGHANTASGEEALHGNTTGEGNVATGFAALETNKAGTHNVADGAGALTRGTEGSENTATGFDALEHNSGSFNVAFGGMAGTNLTTGSHNIEIANEGVAGESGTTRIGTEGTQTRAFMAGVYKKPITTPACAVKVNSGGQLGCNPEENSTAIATFASSLPVTSGNCLAYTEIGGTGMGACPAKTTGFSSSTLLAGPTPANGATVTNLYADTNASVSGTDTVLVAVIDNTSGATLLSCTVNSTNKSSCSNSGESGSAAAGDNIEVKLTISGSSGEAKSWRVRFRY